MFAKSIYDCTSHLISWRKMRFVFFIFSLFFCLSASNAQNTYQILFKNPYNDRIYSMIENSNKEIIGVGISIHSLSAYYASMTAKIWHINNQGDTLTKCFAFHDTTTAFFRISQLDNGNYLIVGNIFIPPDYSVIKMMLLELNQDFEIVTRRLYSIAGYSVLGAHVFFELFNGYLFLCKVDEGTTSKMCMMKLNANYDTIRTRVYSYPVYQAGDFMDGIFSPDSSQIWAFSNGLIYNAHQSDHMIVFDTAMNLVKIKSFPYFVNQNPPYYNIEVIYEHNMSVRRFTDSTFLVGCNHFYEVDGEPQWDVGFSVLDTTLIRKPIKYLGAVDTVDYATFARPTFDFINTDSIYFASMKRNIADFYPQKPSWIRLGILNNQLQPYFIRFYGGDAHYKVMMMHRTSDGGFALFCLRYDYKTQNQEDDIFFLKVNNEGLITGNMKQTICPESVFDIYPNPANDHVTLDLIIPEAEMVMYDISGKVLLKKKVHEGYNSIDCTVLIPGMYIIEVKTKEGKKYSEKLFIK